jgi:hypothetical protein
MCLRRAPEKYIAGDKAPAGAALDRAGLDNVGSLTSHNRIGFPRPVTGIALLLQSVIPT